MEETERVRLYYITSTFLNAYLLRAGYEVKKTARLDNGRIALFYENTDKLHEDIEKFREDYDLKEFITKLKQVQNTIRLHQQKEEE